MAAVRSSCIKSRNRKEMNRSRHRRISISMASLYSLWLVAALQHHHTEGSSAGHNSVDRNNRSTQMLRNNGSANELPLMVLQQQNRQSVLKRRLSANDDNAGTSLFNDDTSPEEIEELMEEGNEDNYVHPVDDDIVSTTATAPSVNSTTPDDENDDGIIDEALDELFDELNEVLGNTTNATMDDLLDTVMETLFGDPSMDVNTTNATTSLVDVFEEEMNGIFGSINDDATPSNIVDEEPEISIPQPTKTSQEDDITTTSFKEKETFPLPMNVTDNKNRTHDATEHGDDEPESPNLIIDSVSQPTIAPQRQAPSSPPPTTENPTESPTLIPTGSPTLERIDDDFDSNDKKTERDDDDVFDDNESSYSKSRPVGGSVPNNQFNLTVVLGTLAAIVGMIFTAWQMSDNPDGLYASLCRLLLTCIQLVFRIIMSPCRKFCGNHHHHHMAGTNGYHEPYGHLPVSTMDYGYKDPTIELT